MTGAVKEECELAATVSFLIPEEGYCCFLCLHPVTIGLGGGRSHRGSITLIVYEKWE